MAQFDFRDEGKIETEVVENGFHDSNFQAVRHEECEGKDFVDFLSVVNTQNTQSL